LAAAHLLSLGRTRVGLLAAAFPGGPASAERPEPAGFRDAFSAHGRAVDESLISFASVGDGEQGETGAAALIRGIVAGQTRSGESGLVVFSYTLAPGAARAIARSGVRVPDELALVMGDEDPDTREALPVPATTVQARKFEMAQAAARLLLRLVRREEVPDEERKQRFPMELMVRWSSGSAPRDTL
jgi:LacI family transcriptional regulator